MKVTDQKAKELVGNLKKTSDIVKFIEEVSYFSGYYSRYSRKPRQNFTNALVTELVSGRFDFYFAPNPIYVLQTDDLDIIAKERLGRDLAEDEKEEAVRLLGKVGIPGWDETLEVVIDQAVDDCK